MGRIAGGGGGGQDSDHLTNKDLKCGMMAVTDNFFFSTEIFDLVESIVSLHYHN